MTESVVWSVGPYLSARNTMLPEKLRRARITHSMNTLCTYKCGSTVQLCCNSENAATGKLTVNKTESKKMEELEKQN